MDLHLQPVCLDLSGINKASHAAVILRCTWLYLRHSFWFRLSPMSHHASASSSQRGPLHIENARRRVRLAHCNPPLFRWPAHASPVRLPHRRHYTHAAEYSHGPPHTLRAHNRVLGHTLSSPATMTTSSRFRFGLIGLAQVVTTTMTTTTTMVMMTLTVRLTTTTTTTTSI